MTAKDRKNKRGASGPQRTLRTRKQRTTSRSKLQLSGGSDGPKRSFPKGTSRRIRKMWKLQESLAAIADFHKKRCAIEEERFGRFPDRDVPKISFKEKPFGFEAARGQELCRSSVVSLALFDGDCAEENMLFACSGIALPHGKSILDLTRFVTSACLVREFNDKRNRDDKLRAALGGPLVGIDERFHGMIVDLCHDGFEDRKCAKFLSLKSLYERLELFQILNPKELHFRDYSLPEGVSSVVPSGFMKTSYTLRSLGYPMPPPLVLEFNGELLNQFEDRFGELRAWKGYPFGAPPNDYFECVWEKLQKEVVTNISRRVVSLASFNSDYSRSFACTGLLIKWHGSRATRTVVLTSANLVRSRANEDELDGNLRIEVFLPPNQRCDGTLEMYNLHYNIAIVSVKKGFNAIRPEDIFDGKKVSAKKKAGIGGPLIDFDGSFVGMNFYDGSDVTPFLPRHVVVDALYGANNLILPSESSVNPVRLDSIRGVEENR
ncbi:hypothetical protein PVAP13_2NG434800 [Panicum virgatum]|uniref:Uncharacterized protein n=1 Tax=Panicum virgatum TaxID=38727 RepID=A0A8T0VSK8_PANVG|nr:hypothetical protein PVAP13_2NG434800 [Panicum virgatum]